MNLKIVKKITEEQIGEKVTKIFRTEHGLHNYNFVITTESRKLIAKVAGSNSAMQSQALKQQFGFLKKYSTQLNLPQPIHYSAENDLRHPILFLEFLDGDHINFNELSTAQIKKLAYEVARIHSITAHKFSADYATPPLRKGTYYDYAKTFTDIKVFNKFRQYSCHITKPEHRKIIDAGLHFLKDELKNKKLFRRTTFSLLHTDIGTYNLIWKQNESFFIDWDDKMYGDPASEIGYIFAINNASSKFRKVFLTEYQKHIWDVHFQERIKFYELMNRLFDVGWSLSKFDKNADTLKTKSKKVYEEFYDERYANLKDHLLENKIIQ